MLNGSGQNFFNIFIKKFGRMVLEILLLHSLLKAREVEIGCDDVDWMNKCW
jgi:hypothetical protein